MLVSTATDAVRALSYSPAIRADSLQSAIFGSSNVSEQNRITIGLSQTFEAKYRSKEEVQKMRSEHDPIEQVKARLLDKKWASEDELKKIDAQIRDTINEAAEFATHDPEPEPAELYTDVLR